MATVNAWLEHYLKAPHVEGARGPLWYDCWGQVREVRHRYYGRRLLPLYDTAADLGPRGITRAYEREAASMRRCGPVPGAIACAFRGRLCVHVGAVIDIDGESWVLETRPGSGGGKVRPTDFEREYLRVAYYDD